MLQRTRRAPGPVTAAPRATMWVLAKYIIQTACCPALVPGPALMVGWSRLEPLMVSTEVGKVWPASLLSRTSILLKAELNEAAKRFPKPSKKQKGGSTRAGQPSAPVNREVQLVPRS